MKRLFILLALVAASLLVGISAVEANGRSRGVIFRNRQVVREKRVEVFQVQKQVDVIQIQRRARIFVPPAIVVRSFASYAPSYNYAARIAYAPSFYHAPSYAPCPPQAPYYPPPMQYAPCGCGGGGGATAGYLAELAQAVSSLQAEMRQLRQSLPERRPN